MKNLNFYKHLTIFLKNCIINQMILLIFILSKGCIEENFLLSQIQKNLNNKTEFVKSVANGINQFAFEFYKKFKEDSNYIDKNFFFSPYSISTAFAIVYEGAKGKTKEEIQNVFHFPEDDNIRRNGFSEIHTKINKLSKNYELKTTNALWAQKDYKFLKEYFNIIKKFYGGKIENLDFKNPKEREKSRKIINNWIEKETNDKIKNLIPKGILSEWTRLVVTNAIYFKGEWLKQFDKKNTREDEFRVSSNKKVKVQMMCLKGENAEFNYMENEILQMIELPYKGEDLSMLVLLPKEDNLEKLEDSLTSENLLKWKEKMRMEKTIVYLPKFKFETKCFMEKMLMEMGIRVAFSMDADFSGMDGRGQLYIDKAIHQAFVEVNEEGTETAAATAIIIREKSMPRYKIFRADHPFIFIIEHKETGNILFIGRVNDPSKE